MRRKASESVSKSDAPRLEGKVLRSSVWITAEYITVATSTLERSRTHNSIETFTVEKVITLLAGIPRLNEDIPLQVGEPNLLQF
jgi:hypothetical protein